LRDLTIPGLKFGIPLGLGRNFWITESLTGEPEFELREVIARAWEQLKENGEIFSDFMGTIGWDAAVA